jgi:hypothetical protein
MARLLLLLLLYFCLMHTAQANVEKTIFVAPPSESPPHDASVDTLLLGRLSEQYSSVRTFINASFPTAESPKGTETWFLLEALRPRRRYELRICWLATVRATIMSIRMALSLSATYRLLALHASCQHGI